MMFRSVPYFTQICKTYTVTYVFTFLPPKAISTGNCSFICNVASITGKMAACSRGGVSHMSSRMVSFAVRLT